MGGKRTFRLVPVWQRKTEPVMLIYGVFITLLCLAMLLWPNRKARAVEDRIASGEDRYFEEQRTYRAYPFLLAPQRIRLAGAIGTVAGIIVCVLAIYPS
jgi:hypothetical protein